MNQYAGLVDLLLARLERISVDSRLAHQASGVRGALLRAQDGSAEHASAERPDLNALLVLGFNILQRAAEERVR